jgi:hypothetical protein
VVLMMMTSTSPQPQSAPDWRLQCPMLLHWHRRRLLVPKQFLGMSVIGGVGMYMSVYVYKKERKKKRKEEGKKERKKDR